MRARQACRLPGTGMTTPAKLPASSHAHARPVLLWLAPLAIVGIGAALLLPPLSFENPAPKAAEPEAVLTAENARGICMELSKNPKEYLSGDEWERRKARRTASCDIAFAAAPYDLTLKVRVALALPHARRAEQLAILREAAAQGSPEAYFWIYESHRSWDRGDLDKPQLVTRAEAERALRMAAQLGDPSGTRTLATLLERGDTVKRDPAAARYWV